MTTDFERRWEEEDDDDRAAASRQIDREHGKRQQLYGSSADTWGDAAPEPTRQPDRTAEPEESQEQQLARPTPEPEREEKEDEKDDSPKATGVDGQPLTTAEIETAEFDPALQNQRLNEILAGVDDRGRLESPDWRELALDQKAGIDDRYIQNAQILTWFQTGELIHLTDPGQAYTQFGRLADETDVRYRPDVDLWRDMFYHGSLPDDEERRFGGLAALGISPEDLQIDRSPLWNKLQPDSKFSARNRQEFRKLIERDIGRQLTDNEWESALEAADDHWNHQLENEGLYRRGLVQAFGAQERVEDVLRNTLETGYGDRFLIITNAQGERFLVRDPGDFNTLKEGDRFTALRIPKDRLLERSDILDLPTPDRRLVQSGVGILAGKGGRFTIPELGGPVDIQPYGGNLPETDLWPSIVKTSTYQGTNYDEGAWIIGDREGLEAAEEARRKGEPVEKHGWHVSIPMPFGRPTNTFVSSTINLFSLAGLAGAAGKVTLAATASRGALQGGRAGTTYVGRQAAEEVSQELAQEVAGQFADAVYAINPNVGTALQTGVHIADLEPPIGDWVSAGGSGVKRLGGSFANTFREFYAQNNYRPYDPDAGAAGDSSGEAGDGHAGAADDFSEASDGAWSSRPTGGASAMTDQQRALISGAAASSSTQEVWTPESVSEATDGAWGSTRAVGAATSSSSTADDFSGTTDGPDVVLATGRGTPASTSETWQSDDFSGTTDGPDIVVNQQQQVSTAQPVETAVPWESEFADSSRDTDAAYAQEQALTGSSRDAWGSMAPVETQVTQEQQLTEQQRQEVIEQQRQEVIEQQRQEVIEQQRQELVEQQRQEVIEQQRQELVEQQRQEVIEQQRQELIEQQRQEVIEQQRQEVVHDPVVDDPVVDDPVVDDPPYNPPFVEDPDPPYNPPFVEDPDPVVHDPPLQEKVRIPPEGKKKLRTRHRFVLPPMGAVGGVDVKEKDDQGGEHPSVISVDDGDRMVIADLNTGQVSEPVASPTGSPGTRVVQRQRRRPNHDIGNVRRYITRSLGMTPEQFNGSRRYSGRAGRRWA